MFRSPSFAGLPSFETMLADIPATAAQVARHLGIKESTLKTYKRTGNAPRAVMLALFWETRWGRSAADVEAANAATTSTAHAARLTEHQARLAGAIWRLEVELDRTQAGKPANLPIWRWG
jgi:hypothetical protein